MEATVTKGPRVLSLMDIVARNAKVETEDVQVPELEDGAVIRLRVLSAGEAIEFYEALKGPASKHAMVRIVQACAVDESGAQLFPEPGGLDAIRRMNLKVVMRLQDAALKLNNLSPDKKEQERLEANRKNGSGGKDQSESSPTDSQ